VKRWRQQATGRAGERIPTAEVSTPEAQFKRHLRKDPAEAAGEGHELGITNDPAERLRAAAGAFLPSRCWMGPELPLRPKPEAY